MHFHDSLLIAVAFPGESIMCRTPIALALSLLLVVAAQATAAEFHVSPKGSPDGDGSQEKPWDLATALAAVDRVGPGDTLWLHEGTYSGGFIATIAGTEEAPVVVRQAAGERATIDCRPRDEHDDGLIVVDGDHAIYRDFEVTCSDPKRETQIKGPWPEDIRRGSMFCRASHVRFVNLVIHDTANGLGFWSEGEGGEVYGCVIFNNGWRGPERGHGHGIYTQNKAGTKRLIDNVLFNQFGYGIHAYGSPKAFLRGFEIEGNVAYNNGCLTTPDNRTPGIFIGGETPVERLVVRENHVWGGGLRLGYPWGTTSEDAQVTDNYIVGGLYVRDFRRLMLSGNTFVGEGNVVRLEDPARLDRTAWDWGRNAYYKTSTQYYPFETLLGDEGRGWSFDEWRSTIGVDADSTFAAAAPTGQRVVVRPNQYEKGRAHVVIYNWDRADEVAVDLSEVLTEGQAFKIVAAADFYGEPIIAGIFKGSTVTLPMSPITPVQPVGMPDYPLPSTRPEFAVFIVLPGHSD
jgi:hypothetical protein